MKIGGLLIALALEVIGIVVIIDSYKLGIGTLSNPGAGSFPFFLGLFLSFLTLPLIIKSLRDLMKSDLNKDRKEPPALSNMKPFVAAIVCLMGYFLLLEKLGFLITTYLFVFGLFLIGNSRKWILALVLSTVVVSLSYLVFCLLLKVSFPPGLLNLG